MKLKENLLTFKSFWTDFIFVFSFAALPSFISLPISIELSWSDLRNSLAGFWRIQQIADEACTSMACLRSSRQENHDNTFLKTHTVVFGSKNKTQMVVFLLAQKKTGLNRLCCRLNCILKCISPFFPAPAPLPPLFLLLLVPSHLISLILTKTARQTYRLTILSSLWIKSVVRSSRERLDSAARDESMALWLDVKSNWQRPLTTNC